MLSKKAKKKLNLFRPQIRSRHPTHRPLRKKGAMKLVPFRSVVRFGSPTEFNDTIAKGGKRVELNSTQSIKNSSNKLLMKECFDKGDAKTAIWWTYANRGFLPGNDNGKELISVENLPYPIIAKHIYGSRGRGNIKLDAVEDMNNWLRSCKMKRNFIFEVYHSFLREYRLHINEEGCFYTCRKVIKRDTPDEKRWYRNDSNSSWLLETNQYFDKPVNWEKIVTHSVRALKSTGLDFGAVDVKVQSHKNQNGVTRKDPDFFIIEINSAPSFGDVTTEKYKEIIPELLKKKKKKHEIYNRIGSRSIS